MSTGFVFFAFQTIWFFLQGRVVTETTTEYKEATDDSGFSDLVGSSNFPQISSNSSFGDAVVQSKPSAESSESSSDEEEDNEEKFQDEALKAHNDYRAKHGVELLKLDKKVRNNVCVCMWRQRFDNHLILLLIGDKSPWKYKLWESHRQQL